MAPYNIEDDEALKQRVWSKTRYDDTQDGRPDVELGDDIRDVKLRFADYGVTDFYADAGIQRAMLYATCIEAKVSVENYSVSSWDVAGAAIDVRGAGESEQMQFEHWAEQVAKGLAAATEADTAAASPVPAFTNTYG